MNNKKKEKLLEAGIGFDGIMERIPGREDLILRLLGKFPNEKCFAYLEETMQKKDYNAAFSHAHNLKGVSANLEMIPLNKAACVLSEKLRAKDYQGVEEDFEKVKIEYQKVLEAIEKLILTDSQYEG